MNIDSESKIFFLALAVSFACSLLLTRLVRRLALRLRLLDPCNDRSLHTEPLPRLGGIAIAGSVAAGLGGVAWLFPNALGDLQHPHLALLAGAVAVHLLGLLDDLVEMRARYKLIGQVAIACAVYFAGLRIPDIMLPGGVVFALPAAVNMALTVTWLVGITNAVNLIDGLDGLAAGVSVIALAALFSISISFGQPGAALLCCALAGATAGFLRYNFEPATIFLGDSGSLLLGFSLAGLGLIGSMKVPGSMALAVPLLALGLPIIDTALAILRRHLRRHPIFQADKGHIHHRLLARGLTPRRVALVLYTLSAVFGGAAVVLASLGAHVLFPVILGAVGVGVFVQWLSYDEFVEFGMQVGRAVRHRESISRNVRFREASMRVASLNTMDDILETLAATFREEAIPRAELRLQRWFLNGKISGSGRQPHGHDELRIWKWGDETSSNACSWEVCFPLLDPDETRIGSLVLWEDGQTDVRSISYLQVVNRALREQLQAKLHGFEWAIASAVNNSAADVDADGVAVGADGMPVAGSVMHLRTPHPHPHPHPRHPVETSDSGAATHAATSP